MCNLYTLRMLAAEVAAHFRLANLVTWNAGAKVYSSMVVREAGGERVVQSMTWVFALRVKANVADRQGETCQ
jgi:hypothetical protein